MWDGLFLLLSFSFVMGLASFLAGLLPLSFGLSQNHSRAIASIGTGLLVGTCLIVIIPEGIETLYSAGAPVDHSHATRQALPTTGAVTAEPHRDPHAWVGLLLIAGYIMMYLIDQLPKHTSSHSRRRPLQISLANLSQGPHRAISPSRAEEGEGEDYVETTATSPGSATTIGLVIHAAADGIALAASSFLSESSTGFVVFLALMIHKAPAAFGLTSVLLKQGLTKRQARGHLIVFSLAAPIGAITTWVGVNLVVGGRIQGEEGTKFVTGLLLLFSGGTFLYVAMHTMQEHDDRSLGDSSNGYVDSSTYAPSRLPRKADHRPTLRDDMLVIVGMLLPLLAQAGHSH